jgi:F-type H+-transporting ATPase subunit alpha
LKQPQYDPLSATEQIIVLLAATEGLFDNVPPQQITEVSRKLRQVLPEKLPLLRESIEAGKTLNNADRQTIVKLAEEVIGSVWKTRSH